MERVVPNEHDACGNITKWVGISRTRFVVLMKRKTFAFDLKSPEVNYL